MKNLKKTSNKSVNTGLQVFGALVIVFSIFPVAIVNFGFLNLSAIGLNIPVLWNPLLIVGLTASLTEFLAVCWTCLLIFIGCACCIEAS